MADHTERTQKLKLKDSTYVFIYAFFACVYFFILFAYVIIIIIKICSAHISTLLGAQGAETKKNNMNTNNLQ